MQKKIIVLLVVCLFVTFFSITGCQSQKDLENKIVTCLKEESFDKLLENIQKYNQKYSDSVTQLDQLLQENSIQGFLEYINNNDFEGAKSYINGLEKVTPYLSNKVTYKVFSENVKVESHDNMEKYLNAYSVIAPEIAKEIIQKEFEEHKENEKYMEVKAFIKGIHNVTPDLVNKDILADINTTPDTPVLKLEGGKYFYSQTVEVEYNTGDEVFYTVNGGKPSKNSPKYEGSIDIGPGKNEVKVIAYNHWGNPSKEVSMIYSVYGEYPPSCVTKWNDDYFLLTFIKDLSKDIDGSKITAKDENEKKVEIRSAHGSGRDRFSSFIIETKNDLDQKITYTIFIPKNTIKFADGDIFDKDITITIPGK